MPTSDQNPNIKYNESQREIILKSKNGITINIPVDLPDAFFSRKRNQNIENIKAYFKALTPEDLIKLTNTVSKFPEAKKVAFLNALANVTRIRVIDKEALKNARDLYELITDTLTSGINKLTFKSYFETLPTKPIRNLKDRAAKLKAKILSLLFHRTNSEKDLANAKNAPDKDRLQNEITLFDNELKYFEIEREMLLTEAEQERSEDIATFSLGELSLTPNSPDRDYEKMIEIISNLNVTEVIESLAEPLISNILKNNEPFEGFIEIFERLEDIAIDLGDEDAIQNSRAVVLELIKAKKEKEKSNTELI